MVAIISSVWAMALPPTAVVFWCSYSLSTVSAEMAPAPYFESLSEPDRTVYDEWWTDRGSELYPKHVFLPMVTDPTNGAAVHWKFVSVNGDNNTDAVAIDRISSSSSESDATHIQVAIAVRAEGWVGFGISEAGGMLGSDIALFKVSEPDMILDTYVVEDRASGPLVDECQNWEIMSSTIQEGWIIVEIIRPLDTMDTQDHQIVNDSTRVASTRLIAAWGDSDVAYHGTNVGKIATRLYSSEEAGAIGSDFNAQMEVEADGFFEIRESQFTIPARDTTYQYVCKNFTELQVEYNLPDLGNGSLYFIGGEAILTPETEQYVHHFIVGGGGNRESCDENYGGMLWGWAPGEEPQAFPSDVGIPMFGPDDQIQSITIQIHYNNPGQVSDQIDSSGMRLYFTTEPRQNEAAWLQLADPLTLLRGEKIGEGLTEYTFTCDGTCSSLALQGEPVTVLAESLHMHQTGARMTNEVIRNGEVVNAAKVDVFEFDQQGSFRVPQSSYQILPGDSFRTTCYYRDGTQFGMSSSEEMCVAFILYYPAKELSFGTYGSFPWFCSAGLEQLPICKEEMQAKILSSEEELGRTFGTQPSQCLVRLSDAEDSSETGSEQEGELEDVSPPIIASDGNGPPKSSNTVHFSSVSIRMTASIALIIALYASMSV